MSFPNTMAQVKDYINGLPSFPVDRETSVRYGFGDGKGLPYVQFNDFAITNPDWSTQGPAFYLADFSISCYAKSNQEAYTLAQSVDALFHLQNVVDDTLCERTSVQIIQEDNHRFHILVEYRITQGA